VLASSLFPAHSSASAYNAVYAIEIALLVATLVALAPLLRRSSTLHSTYSQSQLAKS
jgi:hypothetical protein